MTDLTDAVWDAAAAAVDNTKTNPVRPLPETIHWIDSNNLLRVIKPKSIDKNREASTFTFKC